MTLGYGAPVHVMPLQVVSAEGLYRNELQEERGTLTAVTMYEHCLPHRTIDTYVYCSYYPIGYHIYIHESMCESYSEPHTSKTKVATEVAVTMLEPGTYVCSIVEFQPHELSIPGCESSPLISLYNSYWRAAMLRPLKTCALRLVYTV